MLLFSLGIIQHYQVLLTVPLAACKELLEWPFNFFFPSYSLKKKTTSVALYLLLSNK